MFVDEFGNEKHLTGEIVKGIKITQSFIAKESYLRSVSIAFATYKRKNYCNVIVSIYDDNGRQIGRNTVNAKFVLDNCFHNFMIKKHLDVGRKYNLILQCNDGVRGNAVTAKWGKSNHNDMFPVILDTGLTFGELACSFVYGEKNIIQQQNQQQNQQEVIIESDILSGLVSVVIPSYNCSEYIYKCIESLSKQIYNCFEIVVVDDGSPDVEITKKEIKRAESDFRIGVNLITQEKNQGANVARNLGFYSTRGEYVLFLDADCFLVSDALEKYITALKEHPRAAYAYCNYKRGNDVCSFEKFDSVVLKRRNFISTMSMIRRKCFAGFDETQQRLQDWDLWLTMASMGFYGVWINKVLFETPKRMDGITFGNRISFPEAHKRIINKHSFWDNSGEINSVSGLVVVYKTIDFFKLAYESFRKFYPKVKIVVVDGSGGDDCTKYIKSVEQKDKYLRGIYCNGNLGHGPGMHIGINHIRTPYIYLFDSDTEMKQGGMLELMLERMDVNTYGIGKIEIVNENGINIKGKSGIRYLHPAVAMISKMAYLRHKPFKHHGAPCIDAMRDIYNNDILSGGSIINFNVDEYVIHYKRGTRRNYNNRWWADGSIK